MTEGNHSRPKKITMKAFFVIKQLIVFLFDCTLGEILITLRYRHKNTQSIFEDCNK